MSALPRPSPSDEILKKLKSRGIPLESLADACAACADTDHDEHDVLPFEMDLEVTPELLGSISDLGRQVVIGTRKSDWIKEVTDDHQSLAGLINNAWGETIYEEREIEVKGLYTSSAVSKSSDLPSLESLSLETKPKPAPLRLSITNGSFHPSSHTNDVESVMVFPDYTIVHVQKSIEGAEAAVESFLRENVKRGGQVLEKFADLDLTTHALPYRAVVLICSHKKRDNRCHLSAPLLISQFHHHLEQNDLEVDERGDDLADEPALETFPLESRDLRLEEALKGASSHGGRVGLFKVSHIGGHKYAGNVIIYLPNGTSIWYGRVRPSDIGAIVETTILKGKVIPELLRGGFSIEGKDGKDGILSW